MGVGHYLFGFSGRINRAKIWLYILLTILVWVAIVFAAVGIVGAQSITAATQNHTLPMLFAAHSAIFPLIGLCYLVLFYVGLAVTAKRLHDRNKSAWWLLVFIALPIVLQAARFASMMAAIRAHGSTGIAADPVGTLLGGIAFLISLWGFVELYCLRGTSGDNRYGPDPLA